MKDPDRLPHEVEIGVLTGDAIRPALAELAQLRIAVFAEWPYLYRGDFAYEEDYLASFAAAENAVLVIAKDEDRIVGASTASPMEAQEAAILDPIRGAGLQPSDICYFGESVLLPQYRGQGLGHAFFDARERHARASGAGQAMFASVMRSANHPARPEGYRPLDGFWTARGYAKMDGVTCSMKWRDAGDAAETAKQLQFWGRAL